MRFQEVGRIGTVSQLVGGDPVIEVSVAGLLPALFRLAFIGIGILRLALRRLPLRKARVRVPRACL
jgi:hypothetical protein